MLGDRLKLARKKAGFSMDALVAEMNGLVTKAALSKYERNQMMPGSRVLSQLSRSLNVTQEFLLSTGVVALTGVDFRRRSNTTAKERALVEAIVIEHAERYLAIEEVLEEVLGDEVNQWVDPMPIVVRTEEEAEALAIRYREQWHLGLDPIPNLTALLESLGIKVLMLDLPEKVSGMTCFVQRENAAEVPVIVVNQNMNIEHRRFTLAHELFHRLAEVPDDAEINEEKLMNRCGGAFLMPKDNVIAELGAGRAQISFQELTSIKHRYGVSMAALIVRLGQIGILGESTLSRLFRGPARAWRKQEPDPILENPEHLLELPERFERLCLHAFSEQYISRAKVMELLQRPAEQIEMAMRGPSQDADYCQ